MLASTEALIKFTSVWGRIAEEWGVLFLLSASNRCFTFDSAMRSFTRVPGEISPGPRRLRGRALLIPWVAQAVLFACCAAQDSRPTYPVNGTVENSLTHQPIARALVEMRSAAVLTDSEGRFTLNLPAGVSGVTFRRPGYGGGQFSQRLTTVSENMPPLTLLLTPDASINGHVTLSTGDDPEEFGIQLYRKRLVDGHSRWFPFGHQMTGSDGSFRFLSLQGPGSYAVCVEASPDRFGAAVPGMVLWGYAAACYPGGADVNTAIGAPLTLSPGQQAQLEISLHRQPFYPVSITVANRNPEVPGGIQVFDRSGRPTGFAVRRNSRSGSSDFSLPNGSYYAEYRAWGKTPLYGRLDFTVAGAPLTGLTLVPAPLAPIPVEVHEEFTANPTPMGIGISGRTVSGGSASQPPFQIALTPVDRPFDGAMEANVHGVPGSDGSGVYELDPPAQGVYQVDIQSFTPQTYASSVTSGNTDLLHDPLVIGPGGSAQPIEITLRNDVGFLQCTAKVPPASSPDRAAADFSPLFLSVIPLTSGQRRIYRSVAQLRGGQPFSLPLPPGSYLVLAFENNQQEIDLDDSQAMARLTSQGQTVNIQPGATVQVQVDPIRASDEEGDRP